MGKNHIDIIICYKTIVRKWYHFATKKGQSRTSLVTGLGGNIHHLYQVFC